jgi:hypothetical protein
VKTKEAARDDQSRANKIVTMMLKELIYSPGMLMIPKIKYPVTRVYGNQVVNNSHLACTFGLTKTQLGGRIYEIRSD